MADSLPQLKTDGNKIVTEDGQEVILRGANIMRAEWDNTMVWENKAIPELAQHWHGNVLVRGFASDPVLKVDDLTDPDHDKYVTYLDNLDALVSLAGAHNMYLVLAWRSFEINGEQPPMPTAAAQQALVTLATRYKGQSHVIYALQVEPHDTSDGPDWSILRPLFETMVDAIRLAAAPAEPLILIPGRNWSRDVSGAITNPVNRPNVVYKSHPYNPSSDFQRLFGVTYDAGLPVFVGEFAPRDAQEDTNMSMDDITDLLTFTRDRGIGWTAWILDYGTHPLMRGENDLRPTDPYGTTVKKEMEKVTIDDSTQGTDLQQWQYQGTGWTHCTNCNEPSVTYYKASQSWTDMINDRAALTFFGQQISYFGVVAPWHGRAAVSIDGGAETMIDLYATDKKGNVSLWTSPVLPPGTHTFTLRATGTKNAASTGTVITLDRADIRLSV